VGVRVDVQVGVQGVGVRVRVWVGVGVLIAVCVGVLVAVCVAVGVLVAVLVVGCVGVLVAVCVGLGGAAAVEPTEVSSTARPRATMSSNGAARIAAEPRVERPFIAHCIMRQDLRTMVSKV
jgi:hypothetical protein